MQFLYLILTPLILGRRIIKYSANFSTIGQRGSNIRIFAAHVTVLNTLQLLIFFALLLYSLASHGYYFAYIPDQANDSNNKYLHVINTTLGLYVDKILLNGTPRDVALNHRGNYVFVSAIVNTGSSTNSNINVIDTSSNQNQLILSIDANSVKGMTLSSDDNTLYVTHDKGITRIYQYYEQTTLDLTYRGASLVLGYQDSVLFVIGTDDNNTDGISVVDVSQQGMSEIATYRLGSELAANAVVFNPSNNELFVLTTANHPTDNISGGQVVRLATKRVSTDAIKLDFIQSHAFPRNSFPVDIALNPKNTELYIALSYINPNGSKHDLGFGNGYISLIDIDNFDKQNNVSLSPQGGQYALTGGFGAVHPLAISFDDSGKAHVVKQLWNEVSGIYVSALKESISGASDSRVIREGSAINLGRSASTQLTGKFIGAKCTDCPSGLTPPNQTVPRASAIDPLIILFFVIFFLKRLTVAQLKMRFLNL